MAKYSHYRTSVPGRVPAPEDMEVGEIAMNIADQVLFTKTSDGQVVRISTVSYSKTEMDRKFLPQGILPVTRVGTVDETPLPMRLVDGPAVEISTDIPVLLSGRFFMLAAGTYSLVPVLTGNTTTITVNVYVTLTNAIATLEFSKTSLPETTVRVFVGTINASNTSATAISVSKVSRLDVYRPSLTQQGSAFPVSPGLPNNISQTNW